jgi:APA family basic amino acid/polyamine antiporter
MTVPLRREVGLGGAIALGLGAVLGTGVFVSLGIAAGIAGPALVPAVALAALVATANGLSSAQLAAAHPVSGGTYAYGRALLHPAAGFAAGWTFLAAKSASAATAALGSAGYALHAAGFEQALWARVALALLLVGATTALVAGGVRRSNLANAVLVAIVLAALGAFVVGGAVTAGTERLATALDPRTWFGAEVGPVAVLHATALLFVAYTGYGRVATLGEEVVAPARTIPRAIVATLAATLGIYLAVAAVAVAVVGPDGLAAATRTAAAPLEVVARGFVLPEIAWIVAFGAITAMGGVLLNLLLGLSRVLFAMARDRELPTFFAAVDGGGSPRRAVWAVGGGVAALVLLGDLELTWSFSAFSVLLYYGLTNLAALRLPDGARRFPGAIAAFGLLACVGLAAFVPWPVALAGIALLGAGFVLRALLATGR